MQPILTLNRRLESHRCFVYTYNDGDQVFGLLDVDLLRYLTPDNASKVEEEILRFNTRMKEILGEK